MPCYSPLKGFRTAGGVSFSELRRDDHLGSIEIACGQCIGCRLRRASDWELRITHEASLHKQNCFVTLTYDPAHLPEHGFLRYRDFQLFMKRLRKAAGVPVRFYMCGEYGEANARPHYHACLFGVDFDRKLCGSSSSGHDYFESKILSKLWPLGRAVVQDLVPETAGYCARYIMKKTLGVDAEAAYELVTVDGEILRRPAEFARMSLRPGVGSGWFDRFGKQVHRHDYVVQRGNKRNPPKYYDKLARRAGDERMDFVEYQRELSAKRHADNNTDERLRVREEVAKARIRTLSRSFKDVP